MAEPGRDLEPGEAGNPVDPGEVVDGELSDAETRRLVEIMAHQEFSGPLPPPWMLAQYNDALPDGADRIVKMAEEQSAHRRTVESRGQIFAFMLALVAIIGGIVLIAVGKSTAGLVPLVSAIAGLVGLFIYGEIRANRSRSIERVSRAPTGDQDN